MWILWLPRPTANPSTAVRLPSFKLAFIERASYEALLELRGNGKYTSCCYLLVRLSRTQNGTFLPPLQRGHRTDKNVATDQDEAAAPLSLVETDTVAPLPWKSYRGAGSVRMMAEPQTTSCSLMYATSFKNSSEPENMLQGNEGKKFNYLVETVTLI